MKRIALLGSTGSIGAQTLEVVAEFPDRFRVVALAAGRNVERLAEQVRAVRPELVSVGTEEGARELRERLGADAPEVRVGDEGLVAVAEHPADLVVAGLVGAVGLAPTLAAVRAGRDVALANKEVLVTAGALFQREVRAHGVRLLPVDSEHSAIFQALAGQRAEDVERLLLTASGGPFRIWSAERVAEASIDEALAHPNWDMGPKITIDSATLMNKALEVIEARWLFDVAPERVAVVVHPQSIVHSLVEFVDGQVLAQLGMPDMRGPIALALSYPERLPNQRPAPRPGRGGSPRLRAAGHQALPVPRAGLARARRRGDRAGGAERGQRGGGRRLPGRSHRLPAHRGRERQGAPRLPRRPRRRACGRPRRRGRRRRGRPRCRAAPAGGGGMSALSDAGSFFYAFVLMLGVLITVHEFGHFIVAKWCGVKVLKFSIGFGPAVGIGRYRLAWTRGETEYVIAWLPLGGFVKMLGENPGEEDSPEAMAEHERSLGAQPLFKKLAIILAGPAMNLVLPVFVIMGFLWVGVQTPQAVLGTVEPGSPAARAGLAPGDRITAIEGQPLTRYRDLAERVSESAGRTLVFGYERDGATRQASVAVERRAGLDLFRKREERGWIGIQHTRQAPRLGVASESSPGRAGGAPVRRPRHPRERRGGGGLAGLRARLCRGRWPARPVDRARQRGRRRIPRSQRPGRWADTAALGVVPAVVLIAAVSEASPAERAGLTAGDLILGLEGRPIASFLTFQEAVATSEGRPLAIAGGEWRRDTHGAHRGGAAHGRGGRRHRGGALPDRHPGARRGGRRYLPGRADPRPPRIGAPRDRGPPSNGPACCSRRSAGSSPATSAARPWAARSRSRARASSHWRPAGTASSRC